MPLQTIHYSFYATGADGVTHYKTYAKHNSNFVGTGVPDNSYLISFMGKSNNGLRYEPTATGEYFFRFYTYNADNRKISSSFSTGYALVTGEKNTKDYVLSTFRLKNGGKNHSNQGIKSGFVNDLNPEFSWQVGHQDAEMLNERTEFRITTRPVSNTTTPDSSIYYEITGYRCDLSNPRFIYSYKQNVSASGGPYRNYDVVIETHDRSGNTSAGNSITAPLSATESWSNTNGFDKITVYNNKPTGIWLTTGDETYNGYQTEQWIDGNKDINIKLISGSFPRDIVGARVFYSVHDFANSGHYDSTGLAISSGIGRSDVYKNNILFDDLQDFYLTNSFKVPSSIENTGFVSVSFFDNYELNIHNNIESIPDGDLCPTVPVYTTGSFHKVSIFNTLKMHNTGDASQHVEMQYRSAIGGTGYHTVYLKDNNNLDTIITTFN